MQPVRKRRHPKPTPAQNAGRTLRRAAQIILDRGWQRGMEGTPEKGFCARGAITFAGRTNPTGDVRMELQLFSDYLCKKELGVSIPGFNDAPRRTADEVVSALIDCAEELDPQSPDAWVS